MTERPNEEIRTAAVPYCYLCGIEGKRLYTGVRDRLFGVRGRWDLRKCPQPECGLIWLDPTPVREDIGKAYANYFTHTPVEQPDTPLRRLRRKVKEGYLASHFGYAAGVPAFTRLLGQLAYMHPEQREEMNAAVMYLPSRQRGRLLEVGFGAGKNLLEMSRRGWEVEGVDFDGVAVERVRREYGLNVHAGTLEGQRFPENRFDAVFLSHVIEHVHEPASLLAECRRVLKPSGLLVLLTPNIEGMSHRHFKSDYLGIDAPRHLLLFSPRSAVKLAERTGMKILKLCSTVRAASRIYVSSRNIRRTGMHSWQQRAPLQARMMGQLYQYFQWIVLKFDKRAGDELLIVLEKQR